MDFGAISSPGYKEVEVADEEEDTSKNENESESEPSRKKIGGKRKRATRSAPKKPRKSRKKAKQTERTGEEVMADYSDCELPARKGRGGRQAADILDELSVFTRRKSDPDPAARFYRCVAADNGCDVFWVLPRGKGRVLKHAALCSHITDANLKQRTNSALAEFAPSVLAKAAHTKGIPIPKSLRVAHRFLHSYYHCRTL